mgnify:CR=1 FL=1
MSKIFVTGANGFVGSWLSKGLADRGNNVIAGSREPIAQNCLTGGVENGVYGDLRRKTDWKRHLLGIDTLVHSAGFVHKREPLSDSEREDAKVIN